MTRLVIVGAGGHGAVIADSALKMDKWTEIVFIDDRYVEDSQVIGLPVIGESKRLLEMMGAESEFHIAVGDNRDRLGLFSKIVDAGGVVATIVDPSAVVSSTATLGEGCAILPGAVVNARARLGDAVIVNTAASVDHDCVLRRGAHVSPGARLAGGVTVGEASWVGLGATVNEGIKIGSNVTVGASAAVIEHVESGVTVAGVPARPI